ncbi:MAG: hypothetical protein ACI84C_002513 [Flavobacteriales bacterium]|jgi:hypothetical protein
MNSHNRQLNRSLPQENENDWPQVKGTDVQLIKRLDDIGSALRSV